MCKKIMAFLVALLTALCLFMTGSPAHAASSQWWQKADAAWETGTALYGTPYVYGAPRSLNYSRSFDCSSFTKYIYGKQGIQLNATSATQTKNGYYVPRSSLRNGDLVFFDTSGVNDGNVNHVAMYYNGKLLEASSGAGYVKVVNWSAWWSAHYVTARRVL